MGRTALILRARSCTSVSVCPHCLLRSVRTVECTLLSDGASWLGAPTKTLSRFETSPVLKPPGLLKLVKALAL